MNPDAALHAQASALHAEAIRRLGRNARPAAEGGHEGVLAPELAQRLWSALLEERFTPAQEAALLMGLRVHGESPAMLAAFARASAPHLLALALDEPLLTLHCAGRARVHATAAPLLAILLSRAGVPVLLSTPEADGTACAAGVLRALKLRPSGSAAEAAAALSESRLAWWPLAAWAPALARLMARRAELGFRNSAHSVVKLLTPAPHGLPVMNYTHPAYRTSLAEAARLLGRSAWLARGTEGDPVAWTTATHAPQALLRGATGAPPGAEPAPPARASTEPREDTSLIAGDDAATARYTLAVLEGRAPVPAAIAQQVQALRDFAQAAREEQDA
jgi:anthranilate phosphoribosyltransferase